MIGDEEKKDLKMNVDRWLLVAGASKLEKKTQEKFAIGIFNL